MRYARRGCCLRPVNFLLHAHLAHRDLGSPVAAVGAMLPDLWRMAHRRAHAHRLPAEHPAPLLRAGIAHHTAADRWFHAHPSLAQGEAALLQIFLEEHLLAPKLRLFAHPLWELFLDGALARSLGPASLRSWLQDLFRLALPERDPAQRALAAALGPDLDAFLARMERIDRELLHGPWIDAYTAGEGLAWCLDAMRSRAGLPRLDPASLRRLAARLDPLAPRADDALAALLAADQDSH